MRPSASYPGDGARRPGSTRGSAPAHEQGRGEGDGEFVGDPRPPRRRGHRARGGGGGGVKASGRGERRCRTGPQGRRRSAAPAILETSVEVPVACREDRGEAVADRDVPGGIRPAAEAPSPSDDHGPFGDDVARDEPDGRDAVRPRRHGHAQEQPRSAAARHRRERHDPGRERATREEERRLVPPRGPRRQDGEVGPEPDPDPGHRPSRGGRARPRGRGWPPGGSTGRGPRRRVPGAHLGGRPAFVEGVPFRAGQSPWRFPGAWV